MTRLKEGLEDEFDSHCMQFLLDQFRTVKDQMEYPKCRPPKIAVYGKTGSGKSFLLNKLLGVDVLPFSPKGKSCTSTCTELWSLKVSAGGEGGAFAVVEIHYLDEEAWRQKREMLVEIALKGTSSFRGIAKRLLEHVYGKCTEEQLEKLRDLPLQSEPPAIQSILNLPNHGEHHVYHDIAKVQEALKTLVTLGQNHFQAILARLVHVTGVNNFFPGLPAGACLVDMPGVDDIDVVKVRNATEYHTTECTHTWLCALDRVASDPKVQDMVHCTMKLLADGKMATASMLLLKRDQFLRDCSAGEQMTRKQKMELLEEE